MMRSNCCARVPVRLRWWYTRRLWPLWKKGSMWDRPRCWLPGVGPGRCESDADVGVQEDQLGLAGVPEGCLQPFCLVGAEYVLVEGGLGEDPGLPDGADTPVVGSDECSEGVVELGVAVPIPGGAGCGGYPEGGVKVSGLLAVPAGGQGRGEIPDDSWDEPWVLLVWVTEGSDDAVLGEVADLGDVLVLHWAGSLRVLVRWSLAGWDVPVAAFLPRWGSTLAVGVGCRGLRVALLPGWGVVRSLERCSGGAWGCCPGFLSRCPGEAVRLGAAARRWRCLAGRRACRGRVAEGVGRKMSRGSRVCSRVPSPRRSGPGR